MHNLFSIGNHMIIRVAIAKVVIGWGYHPGNCQVEKTDLKTMNVTTLVSVTVTFNRSRVNIVTCLVVMTHIILL